jgi:hypothetical protein
MILDSKERTVSFLITELGAITGKPAEGFSEETRLIGRDAAIVSRELVELLLALEEFAEQNLNVHFDWTNDSAMSEARSIFRTVGSLAAHIGNLTPAS